MYTQNPPSQNALRSRVTHWAARACAVLLLADGAAICSAADRPHSISLPPETAVLAASALPGYKIAVEKCGICHSADYVNLQPPHMSLAQWTAEMVKMQHAYGAPIDDAEVKLLGVYLAASYGDAATVTAAADTAARTQARSKIKANIIPARFAASPHRPS